jgi:hypothetical protein
MSDPELIVITIRCGITRGGLKRIPNCKFERGFLTDQEMKGLA